MQYVTSVERFALEKGREEGIEKGIEKEWQEEAVRLLRLLSYRFSAVPTTVQNRLQTFPTAQLESLVDRALASQSLSDFMNALPPAQDEPADTQ